MREARPTVALSCKAIRGRILGVGAALLGLGGVWLLVGWGETPPNHTQPNQKPILYLRARRAHLLG